MFTQGKVIVLTIGIVASLLSGCSTKIVSKKQLSTTHFVLASFSEFEGWRDDHHEMALMAFARSCRVIMYKKDDAPISLFSEIGGTAKQWKKPCNVGLKLISKLHIVNHKKLHGKNLYRARMIARRFFEQYFTPYKIGISNHGHGLTFNGRFTGYYEMELQGTRKESRLFPHPVYMPPLDLHKHKGGGHITRSAINKGSLAKKGLEIAWVNDMPRLYFMHIQGTGVIKLKEGGEIKLVWGGCNGFKFKSLPASYAGSTLDVIQRLRNNKTVGMSDMNKNHSYIFFKERKELYPLGAQGVQLMPERSGAIDNRIYPYGAPLWIETSLPRIDGYVNKQKKYNRLFIAQDRGGAINGSIRADLFFGRGKRAEHIAGGMHSIGELYVLFPKGVKVLQKYG